MIRGARAAKRAPSWQDLRAVYPPRRFAGLFGYMARTSCQSQPVFGCMARESCQELAIFSSEAPFGIHGVKKLPRIAARERTAAKSCHGKAPGSASRENLVTVGRRGNAFHGHFAISERPQRHSAMCLNVLRRSPIDARAERPAHALRARRSCPRAARHSAAMPCTVRGAFVAAEKVSCGLRVSMR